MKKIRV